VELIAAGGTKSPSFISLLLYNHAWSVSIRNVSCFQACDFTKPTLCSLSTNKMAAFSKSNTRHLSFPFLHEEKQHQIQVREDACNQPHTPCLSIRLDSGCQHPLSPALGMGLLKCILFSSFACLAVFPHKNISARANHYLKASKLTQNEPFLCKFIISHSGYCQKRRSFSDEF
jgi:hypothetical protein